MADCKRKTANLFDATLERGSINIYGVNVENDTRLRTGYVNAQANTIYTLSYQEIGFQFGTRYYSNSGFIDYSPSWLSIGDSFTTPNNCTKIRFLFKFDESTIVNPDDISNIMLNLGSTALPYEPYGWLHSLRKLTTATDTITTLPADLYADGTNATVGLKGNMSQAGTPTPANPIQPSECGERTGNLCEINGFISGETELKLLQTVVLNAGTYTYSCIQNDTLSSNTRNCLMIRIGQAVYTYESTQTNYHLSAGKHTMTFTVPADNTSVELRYWTNSFSNACSFDDFMLNTGSTALPYEPYGYKLAISSASTTTPVYLGEVQSTRRIKKLVLTGQEDWNYSEASTNARAFLSNFVQNKANVRALSSHYAFSNESYPPIGSFNLNISGSLIFGVNIGGLSDFKTYLQQQYTNGTPVTVYYVLATPETAVVNEPIRKIGDYADEVSGITIPTTTGADSFDVLTTLKPSEVELTYTGWHDASVKEKSKNLFPQSSFSGKSNDIRIQFNDVASGIVFNTGQYVFTVKISTELTSGVFRFCYTYTDDSQEKSGWISRSTSSVTVVSNANKTIKSISITDYNSYGDITLSEIMLNTGSTALSYEPYWQ